MNLNDYLMIGRNGKKFHQSKRIECKDGFSLSVQANKGCYCYPRDGEGPWDQVEVGFPSAKPEFIMDYAEDADRPTETVYGYVPISLVEKLIEHHGGMKL